MQHVRLKQQQIRHSTVYRIYNANSNIIIALKAVANYLHAQFETCPKTSKLANSLKLVTYKNRN